MSTSPNGQIDPQTGEAISIEQMPTSVSGAPLQGTHEQLSFDLGSEFELADSTLRISSLPPLTVDGQFAEGDRVRFILEVEVEFVSFPPIKDRGMRIGTERRHHAFVLSALPAD